MNRLKVIAVGILLSFGIISYAAENVDHSQHEQHVKEKPGYQATKAKGGLDALPEIPESGKSREAGFDKRYAMEPTTAHDKLADLCAKGSRGLIMLDRKTWEQCGGAPKGAPAQHDSKEQKATSTHKH